MKFGPGTLQRLPALTFTWAPQHTFGPARFEVEADAVRLAPLFSNTGDEGTAAAGGALLPEAFQQGVDRLFVPTAGVVSRSGVGDRIWQLGEREARDRVMVMPRVSIASQPFGAFSATASAAWRQLGWFGEASGRSWSRGYLLVGGRLETELSRSFADGAVRHAIQPLAEVRAVPVGVAGASGSPLALATPAPVPYDAVDAAVPDLRPRFQGVLELRQRLLRRDGVELFRLDVGQGFELSGPSYAGLSATLGESYGRFATRVGWFSASGTLRFDPLSGRLASDGITPVVPGGITRVTGRADLDDGRGHGAYVGYENLLMEGTARSRQPIDLLFLIDRGFTSATRVQQLTFGARWDFGPIQLRYDALVAERTVGTENLLVLAQQSAALGFAPACDCWRLDIVATQPTYPVVLFPQIGFNVSISRFGSIGTR